MPIEALMITVILLGLGAGGYWLYRLNNGRRALERLRVESESPAAHFFPNYVANKPGVVLFTADYCGPCKHRQRPTIQKVIAHFGEQTIQFILVDVDELPEVANRWGVMSLPTTVILDKAGQPVHINHGVTPQETLQHQLQQLLV
jgi:thioredoxin 1